MAAAQVKYFSELAVHFRQDVMFMSVDNKAKVNVGAPANGAVRRPTTMYHKDAQPDNPDHQFPLRNAKIIPFGYMEVSPLIEKSHRRSRHMSWSDLPPLK